jgi:hypothetical protein
MHDSNAAGGYPSLPVAPVAPVSPALPGDLFELYVRTCLDGIVREIPDEAPPRYPTVIGMPVEPSAV